MKYRHKECSPVPLAGAFPGSGRCGYIPRLAARDPHQSYHPQPPQVHLSRTISCLDRSPNICPRMGFGKEGGQSKRTYVPPPDVISTREWSKKVIAVLRVHGHPRHVVPSSVEGVAHVTGRMLEDREGRNKRGRSPVAASALARPPRAPSSSAVPSPSLQRPPRSSTHSVPRCSVPRESTASLPGPPEDVVSSTATEMVRIIKGRTRSQSQGFHYH